MSDAQYYTVIEKQDFYEIIQNKYGELAIFIDARAGVPQEPLLEFDGKETALLKRDANLAIRLDNIDIEAKDPLASSEVVMIAELRGKIVERVYGVAVENVEEIIFEGITRGDEIRKAKSKEEFFEKFGVVKTWASGK